MSKLVYRVHPIPPTLKDYIFDFGSLEPSTEALYINSMVSHCDEIKHILGPNHKGVISVISLMISKAQDFIRFFEGDPSVVSLRDVKRVLVLFQWFYDELPEETSSQVTPVARAITLALAHVYCYRISSNVVREEFWDNIAADIRVYFEANGMVKEFQLLSVEKTPQVVVSHAQKIFVDNLEIEDGISMNEALSENLFVSIVCILNKIPIFIVGKPGTSKTLAIQVIASNLRGDKSVKPFWHDKPSVHIFQYQCSPLSTSNSIKFQFESARAFQEHSSNVLTVLLLDEVGLAENSPDMPLKVLHYMLVNPPIAIVGLSNWALDSSKMNRAICLQRPEPSETDIMLTGRSIVASGDAGIGLTDDSGAAVEPATANAKKGKGKKAAASTMLSVAETTPLRRQTSRSASQKPWLGPLAKIFHDIYTQQRDLFESTRDFIGMRDYYGLLKYLRVETLDTDLTPAILSRAIARNLGGRPDSFEMVLTLFLEACFPPSTVHSTVNHPLSAARLMPAVMDLINENLFVSTSDGSHRSQIVVTDPLRRPSDCRHLMILSQNEAVLQLLFGCKVIDEATTSVLIGSKFRDDLDELHLIQQINKVKRAMQEGKVAVLVHNENIYESLYDLLNQRYVKQRDPATKEEIRLLRLAMGSKSQLCPVHDNFKLIVVVQQSHAYESLDLPLLNRFEKQVLTPKDLLISDISKTLLHQLDLWCQNLLIEVSLPTMDSMFCGYNADTLSSLVLNITNFCLLPLPWNVDELLLRAKLLLLRVASPLAISHSRTLKSLIHESYKKNSGTGFDAVVEDFIRSRSHLFAILDFEVGCSRRTVGTSSVEPRENLFLLATRAPVHHFEISLLHTLRKSEQAKVSVASENSLSFVYQLRESDIITVQLAHVASERFLSHLVGKFYNDTSSAAPKMLVILSDPLYCPPSVISHARQIVFQAYKTRAELLGVDRVTLFIVHLPPGVSSRVRDFKLDMYPPWNYLFLDELVDPVDAGLPDLMKLLTIPLHDLCCTASLVNIPHIMKSSFQSAMRYCAIPPLEETSSRSDISYIKMIKELLEFNPFTTFVQEAVLRCVFETEHAWKSSKMGSMELHVYRACENLKGSLRQSLQLTVEGIIIQGFAHVLRQLDCNYNLTLLYWRMSAQSSDVAKSSSVFFANSAFLDIWLGMAHCLLSPEAIALTCNFDLSQSPTSIVVANTGLGGAFACRFPFSDKLIQQLQQTIRKAPEPLGTTLAERCCSLTALVNTAITSVNFRDSTICVPVVLGYGNGCYAGKGCSSISSTGDTGVLTTSYLYDFVASIIYPMPGLSLMDEVAIVIAFFNAAASSAHVDSRNIYLPGYVHAFYWQLETRIYHFMSAISHIGCSHSRYNCPFLLPDDFKTSVNGCLQSVYAVSNLKLLDISLLNLILGCLCCSLRMVISCGDGTSEYNKNVFKWSLLFGSLLADIEALVTIMLNESQLSDDSVELESQVLGNVWFLKLVNAICCTYGANTDMLTGGRELLLSLHSRLESIRLDPTSYDSLTLYLRLCEMESSGMYRSLLVHCYLSKFVIPEFNLLRKMGRIHTLSLELLSAFGNLTLPLICSIENRSNMDPEVIPAQHSLRGVAASASSSSSCSTTSSNLVSTRGRGPPVIDYDMVLVRSIVELLYKAFTTPLYFREASVVLNSLLDHGNATCVKLLQLFLERITVDYAPSKSFMKHDSLEDVSLCECLEDANSIGALTNLFKLVAEDIRAQCGHNVLTHVAKAKVLLKRYVHEIFVFLNSAKSTDSSKFPKLPVNLRPITRSLLAAQVYSLTSLLHAGGKSSLVSYLRQPEPPVLPFDISGIDPKAAQIKMLDPFSMLCNYQAYNSACNTVIQMQTRSSYEYVASWSKEYGKEYKLSSWTDKICILVAAIHTQMSGSGLPVAPEVTETLVEWVRKDFSSSKSSTNSTIAINFYTDLVRCCLRRQNFHAFNVTDSRQCLLDNLRMHSTFLASCSSSGWLNTLLTDPSSLKTSFLPAMMDDESAALMQFVDSRGNVSDLGWYECPNGHRYAVGECTYPMQQAKCPECKAEIGGSNHNPVAGVKRLGKVGENGLSSKRGYLMSVTLGPKAYDIFRLGKLTTVVLRLIQHLIMLTNAKMYPEQSLDMKENRAGARTTVGSLIFTESANVPESRLVVEALEQRVIGDWEALVEILGINEEDIAMGLHMMINKLYFTGESKFATDESSYGEHRTGTYND
jgi:hypothetical protein